MLNKNGIEWKADKGGDVCEGEMLNVESGEKWKGICSMTDIKILKSVQVIENQIGGKIDELERLIKEDNIEKVKIPFPCGVIRKADYFRNELYFIDDYTLNTNVAYHLMLGDFYDWLFNRFNIGLTVKEMLIKQVICLYANIIEAISKYIVTKLRPIVLYDIKDISLVNKAIKYLRKFLISNELKAKIIETLKRVTEGQPGLNKSLTILEKNSIIGEELKKSIIKLWTLRNKEHLFNLKETEYQKYNEDLYENTLWIWEEFKKALQKAYKKGKL